MWTRVKSLRTEKYPGENENAAGQDKGSEEEGRDEGEKEEGGEEDDKYQDE